MSSKMLLLLLSDQVLCLYLISKPPKDGLFVMPSFIYYPLLLCFKLNLLSNDCKQKTDNPEYFLTIRINGSAS